MRSSTRLWFAVVLALGVGPMLACDAKAPPKSTLEGWPPGEPVVVGRCHFVLHQANLWHSNEWTLEVEVSEENTGTEAVYCGTSVQAMTETDTPLTEAVSRGGERSPGETGQTKIRAREADVTGMSTGAAEGAWVYVELAEGRWPMAVTHGVRVTPERVRPPS